MRLEINYIKKKLKKNIQRLINILPNNQWINEEIEEEI